jgi:general secretion pathway protein E
MVDSIDAHLSDLSAAGSPTDRFLRCIPREFARRHLVLSAGESDGVESLLVAASTPPWIAGNVALALSCEVRTYEIDGEEIALRIDRAYDHAESKHAGGQTNGGETRDTAATDALLGESRAEADAARVLKDLDRDLLRIDGKGPVIRLVDAVLFEALSRRASDVHVQPLADRTLVRYRVDGVLFDVRELPVSLASAVISRIKVMAQMDVAERSAPQDGRATVTIGAGPSGRSIDLRVSTLPSSHGERAVIRLLDTAKGLKLVDLSELGMPGPVRAAFEERCGRAHGIVLVTGPTGSGKTTTLYATLRLLAQPTPGKLSGELNIMTIEDPIEYELSTAGLAVSQTQTNIKKGLSFASGLRHILRQDPDIVMVGEIRDAETARMALQASLTGHLVLSTLHTNDAATAVTRLFDLGIEPYLVGASLSAVLAQRLLRRVHQPCAGKGCEQCAGSGYSGRIGVFELLHISEAVRRLVTCGAGEQIIREAARQEGMRTLQEEGHRLVEERLTTQAEFLRIMQGIE